ncbi:YadA-like family protein [Moraxella sp. ZY21109]|uniref:ESPR-type extended signal peptide-containing protein n=1 Tax=Moraxella sp. ZY21109 TaxID=2911969 RepID=UPI003D7D7235
MNKVFKVVWCEATGSWVAVSEIAKAQGKTKSKTNKLAKAGLAVMGLASAVVGMEAQAAAVITTSQTGLAIGVNGTGGAGAVTNATSQIAIGARANASSGGKSIAIGSVNGTETPTTASGNFAIAVGSGAQAVGLGDVVIGADSKVHKLTANPLGGSQQWYAPDKTSPINGVMPSVVLGYNATSAGFSGDVMIGAHATNNFSAVMLLNQNQPDGPRRTIGQSTGVGSRAFVLGDQATALGADSTALGHSAIAIGGDDYTTAAPVLNTRIGALLGTTQMTDETVKDALEARFRAANGGQLNGFANTSLNLLSTRAMEGTIPTGTFTTTVHAEAGNVSQKNGYAFLRTAAGGEASIAMGTSTQTSGAGAVAIGLNALAYDDAAISQGVHSRARGLSSIAVGTSADAVGNLSNAIGFDAHAVGTNASALGSNSHAVGNNTIAIGSDATAGGGYVAKTANAVVQSDLNRLKTVYAQVSQMGQFSASNVTPRFVAALRDDSTSDYLGQTKEEYVQYLASIAAKATGATDAERVANAKALVAAQIDKDIAGGVFASKNVADQHAIAIGTNATSGVLGSITIGANSHLKTPVGATNVTVGTEPYGNTPFVLVGYNTSSQSRFGDTIVGAWAKSENPNFEINQATVVGNRAIVYGDQGVALGADTRALGNSSVAIGGDDLIGAAGKLAKLLGVKVSSETSPTVQDITNVTKKYDTFRADLSADLRDYIADAIPDTHSNSALRGRQYPNTAAIGDASLAIGTGSQTLGTASNAIGANALAKGLSSTAVGTLSRAWSESSIAMGTQANASGVNATAIGRLATAKQLSDIAIGTGANAQSTNGERTSSNQLPATGAVAIGKNASATGSTGHVNRGNPINTVIATGTALGSVNNEQYSTGVAIGTNASTHSGVSIGDGAASTQGGLSVVIGPLARSENTSSVVIGAAAQSKGNTGVAIGRQSVVNSSHGIAIGNTVVSDGKGAMAMGHSANATGYRAIAFGSTDIERAKGVELAGLITSQADSIHQPDAQSKAAAQDAIAFGSGTKALHNSTIAMGAFAKADANRAIAIGGIIQDDLNVLVEDGKTHNITAATAENAIAIGTQSAKGTRGTKATGQYSVAMGTDALASGENATAIGRDATASGKNSISVGVGNQVSGENSGAFGDPSIVAGTNSYSLGNNNIIANNTDNAISIGGQNNIGNTAGTTTRTNGVVNTSVAVTNAAQGANRSMVIGFNNTVSADDVMVLGNNVNVTNAADKKYNGSVILGQNASVTGSHDIANVTEATVNGITYGSFAGKVADTGRFVSVGAKGDERKIINLAAGNISATSTEAINGSQLYAVIDKMPVVSTVSNEDGKIKNDAPTNPNAVATTSSVATAVNNSFWTLQNHSAEVGKVNPGDVVNFESSDKTVTITATPENQGVSKLDFKVNVDGSTIKIGNDGKLYAVIPPATAPTSIPNTYFHVNGAESVDGGDSATNSGPINAKAGATGTNSLAAGVNATATAANAVSVGRDTKASGNSSVAVGLNANATNTNAVAVGVRANASGNVAVAIGENATASNEKSIAIGGASKSGGDKSIAIGDQANATNTHSFAMGGNSLSTGTNAVAVGSNTKATGNFTVALGNAANASVHRATAIGVESKASGTNSTAVGSAANATATNAIALGNNAQATAGHTIATGVNATAGGVSAIATGNGAIANGANSIATGFNATTSTSTNAVAIGREATVGENMGGAVAVGAKSVASMGTVVTEATVGPHTYTGFAGTNLKYDASNSADPNSMVFSVGSAGNERQIQNVAAGRITETSTDAINGSQLYAVAKSIPVLKAGDNITLDTVNGVTTIKATDTNTQATVTAGKGVEVALGTPNSNNGTANYTVSAKVDGTSITTNNDGALTVVNTTLTPNPDTGAIDTPTEGDKLVNATTVANAINKSGWTTSTTDNPSEKVVINPGDAVNYVNGNGTTANVIKNNDGGVNVSYNINTSTVAQNPTNTPAPNTVTITEGGKAAAPTTNGDNSFLTTNSVVDLVNNVSWTAKQGASVDTNEDTSGKATDSQISAGDNVTFIAGKNMALQKDGEKFIYATKDDVEFKSIKAGDDVQNKPITIGTTDGKNVIGGLDTTIQAPTTTPTTAKPTTGLNNAATLGDVLNAGWNLKENGTAKDVVTPYDTVDFVNSSNTVVNISTANGVSTVKVDVKVDGTTVTNTPEGLTVANTTLNNDPAKPVQVPTGGEEKKFVNAGDLANTLNKLGFNVEAGKTGTGTNSGTAPANTPVVTGETVKFIAGDNIDIAQNGKDFTISAKVNTLPPSNTTLTVNDGKVASPTPADEGNKLVNATTVANAINESGWTTTNTDGSTSVINPGDKVNYTNGTGTTANVVTNGNTTTVKFDVNTAKEPTVNPNGTVATPAGTDGSNFVNATTLANTVNNVSHNITIGSTTDKFTDQAGKSDSKVKAGDTITLVSGQNLIAKQDGNNITFATAENVTFNNVNTTTLTVGDVNKPADASNPVVNIKTEAAKPATNNAEQPTSALNITSADGKPTQITGVGSSLDKAPVTTNTGTQGTTPGTAGTTDLVNLGSPTTVNPNAVATVGDLQNMGWVLSAPANGYVQAVKNAQQVNFVGEGATVTGANNGTAYEIKVAVNKTGVTVPTGTAPVATPTDANNVTVNNGKAQAPTTPAKANDSFLTAGDVVNLVNNVGWTTTNTNGDKVVVNPGDTVNYESGNGTTANVVTNGNTTTVKFDVNTAKEPTVNPNGTVATPAGTDGSNFVNATTLANTVNNVSHNITIGSTTDKFTDQAGKSDSKVKAGDTITLVSGQNLIAKQDGNNITFATAENVTFNNVNTTTLTVGDVNKPADASNPVVNIKTEAAKPATNNAEQPTSALNITSADGKPTQITGVGSSLNTTTVNTNPTGISPVTNTVPSTLVDLKNATNPNAVATVGDLQNMGWVVSTQTGEYKDTVKNANEVKFIGTGAATVTGVTNTTSGIREITIDVKTPEAAQLPVVYTTKAGEPVVKAKDGNFYKPNEVDSDGNVITPTGGTAPTPTKPADVIASMNNGDNSTTAPTTLANVKGNLAPTYNKDGLTEDSAKKLTDDKAPTATTNATAPTGEDLKKVYNNAATVGDVLNAGFNVQENGVAKDFVKAYDTVGFVNGTGTTANVSVNADGSVANVTFNVNKAGVTTAPTNTSDANNVTVNNAGKVIAPTNTTVAGNTFLTAGDVATVINNSGWTTKNTDGTTSVINPGDAVNYENGNGTTAKVETKDGVTTVKYDVNTAQAPTINPNGTVATPTDGGNFVNATTLANTINNVSWNVTAFGTNATGAKEEQVKAGEVVTFEAGKNMTLTQQGQNFTYATADNVTFNNVNTTTLSVGSPTDASKPVVNFTTEAAKPASNNPTTNAPTSALNITSADGKPTQITGVGSSLNKQDVNTNPFTGGASTPSTATLVNLTEPSVNPNAVATVGDLQNMGWVVSASNGYSDAVKNANEVKFVAGNGITVTGETKDNVREIKIETNAQSLTNNSQLPVVYTLADGTKVYPHPTEAGKFNTKVDGTGDDVAPDTVIASMNSAGNNTTAPTTLANVKGNLAPTYNKDGLTEDSAKKLTDDKAPTATTNATAPTGEDLKKVYNNAATVGDVLNAGFNVQENGVAKDFVKAYDTVGFVNGTGTTANVSVNADGSVANVTFNVNKAGVTTAPTNTSDANNVTVNNAGKVIAPTNTTVAGNTFLTAGDVATVINNSGWTTKNTDGTTSVINPGDAVNYENGNGTTAKVETKDGVTTVKYDVNTAQAPTINPNGTVATPTDGGNFVNATTLANTINNVSWNVTAFGTNATGAKEEQVKAGEVVTFEAGKNMTLTQNGQNFTYATADNVTFNNVNTTTLSVGSPTDATKPVVNFTTEAAKPATNNPTTNAPTSALNITSADGKPTQITGVGSSLNITTVATNPDANPTTAPVDAKFVNLGNTTNPLTDTVLNSVATVRDLQNMGWVVSASNGYSDAVKNANEVKFIGGTGITVKGETKGDIREIVIETNAQGLTNNSQLPVVYTLADGTKVYKNPNPTATDGSDAFTTNPDGTGDKHKAGDVIASMNSAGNNTTAPTTLANVKGNLAPTYNKDGLTEDSAKKLTDDKAPTATTNATAPTGEDLKKVYNNAATVGDVLNAGFNVQENGVAKDFVKAYDTVGFVNGTGTTANVSVNADGSVANVTFNVNKAGVNTVPTNTADTDNVTVNTKGQAVAPTDANKADNSFLTAGDVVDVVNNTGWTTKNTDGTTTVVKPGHAVNFVDGNGITADVTTTGDATTVKFNLNTGSIGTNGGIAANTTNGIATTADVVNAINNSGWKAVANNGANPELINPGETVSFNNGTNIVVTQTGNNFTFATTKDIGVEGNLTVAGNTTLGNVTVKLNSNVNMGNNTVAGVKSNLVDVTPTTNAQPTANTPANQAVNKNNAATVGDVLNAGWNLQGNGQAVDTVVHNDTVNFEDGRGSNVVVAKDPTTGANSIKVNTAVGYVTNTGTETTTPTNTVKLFGGDENNPVQVTNVASGVRNPDGSMPANRTQAIQNATGDTLNNAANIGDLQALQMNVTNVHNNFVNNITQIIGNPEIIKTYDAAGNTEKHTISIVTAINNMNKEGIRFFHTNSEEKADGTNIKKNAVDSSASGTHATAIGYQASASGNQTVALGNSIAKEGTPVLASTDRSKIEIVDENINGTDNKAGINTVYTNTETGDVYKAQITRADGDSAIAIGTGSQALGNKTIAVGYGNVVTGNNSGAFGDPNYISGNESYAVGNNNNITTTNTHVVGNNVKVTADNSVALGNNASITAGNAVGTVAKKTDGTNGNTTTAGTTGKVETATVRGVTYGGFAGATSTGAVSVGASGAERRIQNVAAGEVSATSTDAINGSQLYAVAGAVSNIAGDINNLNKRLGDVADNAYGGVAQAIATAGLPQAYLPGKSLVAVGAGHYKGETGYAVSFSSISDGGNWIFKGTGSGSSQGNVGGSVAIGYQW